MNVSNQVNVNVSGKAVETATSLRKLYFIRAGFSIIWVILVSLLAKTNTTIATVLFIIYPAWDAIATYMDVRATSTDTLKIPQYVNGFISIIATIGVFMALKTGIADAILVFGIWAISTGLIQLILGVRRRRELGGQWLMILSGGQSMLAGAVFIVTAHKPDQGINSLVGYAAFGAFYFLFSAFRLSKPLINKVSSVI
ncbi:MAG: hypothetical protein EOO85_11975 [Pedobacter sp.]|nr:MAG: hypothetical protein EOO85_11975 [Pedobacter sp.]